MDAVQQANSGHPGTPMAMAPVAYALWARHMAQRDQWIADLWCSLNSWRDEIPGIKIHINPLNSLVSGLW